LRVLVATKDTQGERGNDFSWTEEGELVTFTFECDSDEDIDDRCGCMRSMTGLKTRKGTTTFKVSDIHMHREEFLAKLMESAVMAGYLDKENPDKEMLDSIYDDAIELSKIAQLFNVGTVLEKRGNVIQERMMVKL